MPNSSRSSRSSALPRRHDSDQPERSRAWSPELLCPKPPRSRAPRGEDLLSSPNPFVDASSAPSEGSFAASDFPRRPPHPVPSAVIARPCVAPETAMAPLPWISSSATPQATSSPGMKPLVPDLLNPAILAPSDLLPKPIRRSIMRPTDTEDRDLSFVFSFIQISAWVLFI